MWDSFYWFSCGTFSSLPRGHRTARNPKFMECSQTSNVLSSIYGLVTSGILQSYISPRKRSSSGQLANFCAVCLIYDTDCRLTNVLSETEYQHCGFCLNRSVGRAIKKLFSVTFGIFPYMRKAFENFFSHRRRSTCRGKHESSMCVLIVLRG
jgi:hypothetical protein